MSDMPPVLIVTLPLQVVGGVAEKARLLARVLRDNGRDVSFAEYAAHRLDPALNTSIFGRGGGSTPAVRRDEDAEGFHRLFIGCRNPEMEYPYTAMSERWAGALSGFERVVAVGGSPLIANPVAAMGKTHFLWCADDLHGDREARYRAMGMCRRVFDRTLIQPTLLAQQGYVMAAGAAIFGVSRYTVERLRKLRPTQPDTIDRLAIPVDTDFFHPPSNWQSARRLGFAGRIGDPRKNPDLLLAAFKHVSDMVPNAELHISGPSDKKFSDEAERLGLSQRLNIHGVLSRDDLRGFYQSLDVFVIPSQREGLGIVGLEAMACGTPVVSTRCGGPEDYVVDDVTGYLVEARAEDLGGKVCTIMNAPELRSRMSAQARHKIETEFSIPSFTAALDHIWRDVWDEPLVMP